MTLNVNPKVKADQLMQELLAQRDDAALQARYLEETRQCVREYEARFGIPSERIADAINSGELVEDREVGHWIFQYRLLCRVEEG